MSRIMRDLKYDGKQKLILLAIADMVDKNGVGFASYRQIQEVTDVSTVYLRKCIQQFVEDGRLQIVSKGSGKGKATVYRVITSLDNSVTENSVTDNSVLENYDIDNCVTPEGNCVTPPSNPPSYTSLETSSVLNTPKNSAASSIAEKTFDQFWSAYPRKNGKASARKAWAKAVAKADPDHIINAALSFSADPNRVETYTAHPSTWLNDERWDDEPLPARSTERSKSEERLRRNVAAMERWEPVERELEPWEIAYVESQRKELEA